MVVTGGTTVCHPVERLLEGRSEFGDAGHDYSKLPSWFNLELARKGQKLASEKYYGLFQAHFIALYMLLFPEDSKILFYTQSSNTKEKALRRYLSTILHIKIWYTSPISEDLSSPFFKSLEKVRSVHSAIGKSVQKQQPDFSKPMVEDPFESGISAVSEKERRSHLLWDAFRADVQDWLKTEEVHPLPEKNPPGFQYFNQGFMSGTLLGFAALPVLFPNQFGLTQAGDEELEGFIHLWAIIAHMLGMKPEYNMCLLPDMKSFREYTTTATRYHFMPHLANITYETEILGTVAAEAVSEIVPFLNLELVLVQILEEIFQAPATRLRSQIGWSTVLGSFIARNVARPLGRFVWFERLANAVAERLVTSKAKSL